MHIGKGETLALKRYIKYYLSYKHFWNVNMVTWKMDYASVVPGG